MASASNRIAMRTRIRMRARKCVQRMRCRQCDGLRMSTTQRPVLADVAVPRERHAKTRRNNRRGPRGGGWNGDDLMKHLGCPSEAGSRTLVYQVASPTAARPTVVLHVVHVVISEPQLRSLPSAGSGYRTLLLLLAAHDLINPHSYVEPALPPRTTGKSSTPPPPRCLSRTLSC